MTHKSTIGLLTWAAAVVAGACCGQEPLQEATAELSVAQQREVLRILSARLRSHYVFPEIAESFAARLDDMPATEATDPSEFARALTEMLRSENGDRHFAVWVVPQVVRRTGETEGEQGFDYWPTHGRPANFGFRRVEVLAGNDGYLRVQNFSMDEWYEDACRAATAAMGVVAGTDALIIDVRGNPGGGARLIWFLASYLFGPEPVHLNDYFMRVGNRTIECWTEANLPGPRLAGIPVHVLVDRDTFSAGEGLAYGLKHVGRATIVGERTGGGSHGGSSHQLGHGMEAYVPHSCSVHPATGTDFEGIGVEPDVTAASAEALAISHRLLLEELDRRAGRTSDRDFYLAAIESAAKPHRLIDEGSAVEDAAVVARVRELFHARASGASDRLANVLLEGARVFWTDGTSWSSAGAHEEFAANPRPGRPSFEAVSVRGDLARVALRLEAEESMLRADVQLACIEGSWRVIAVAETRPSRNAN